MSLEVKPLLACKILGLDGGGNINRNGNEKREREHQDVWLNPRRRRPYWLRIVWPTWRYRYHRLVRGDRPTENGTRRLAYVLVHLIYLGSLASV